MYLLLRKNKCMFKMYMAINTAKNKDLGYIKPYLSSKTLNKKSISIDNANEIREIDLKTTMTPGALEDLRPNNLYTR